MKLPSSPEPANITAGARELEFIKRQMCQTLFFPFTAILLGMDDTFLPSRFQADLLEELVFNTVAKHASMHIP